MKKILSAIFICTILFAGCGGDDKFQNALEQSKIALQNHDYQAAFNHLKIAKDAGHLDDQSYATYQALDKFLKAKAELAENDTKDALEKLNEIPANLQDVNLSAEIENLRNQIQHDKNAVVNFHDKIETIEDQIDDGDYVDAALNIADLLSKEGISQEQRQKVEELHQKLEDIKSKVNLK